VHAVIDNDEEIKKIRSSINSGIEKTAGKLQEYLGLWTK